MLILHSGSNQRKQGSKPNFLSSMREFLLKYKLSRVLMANFTLQACKGDITYPCALKSKP